jgi:hypothetical protein
MTSYGNPNVMVSTFALSNVVQDIQDDATWSSNSIFNLSYATMNMSNTLSFASNTAVQAYNTAIFASNTAVYGSNTARFASNTTVWTSNTVVWTSNTSINASNVAHFGSNASVFASNTAQALSNFASNAFTFACNTAVYASNSVALIPSTYWTTHLSNNITFSNVGIMLSNPKYPLDVLGTIQSTAVNSYRQLQGDYATFWKNTGCNFSLLIDDTRYCAECSNPGPPPPIETYTPFFVNFANGVTSIGGSNPIGVLNVGDYNSGACNVGISTITPREKLDVNGSGIVNGVMIIQGRSSNNMIQGTHISWNRESGFGETHYLNQIGLGSWGGHVWGQAASNSSNIYTPYMRLDKNGNLGIGQTFNGINIPNMLSLDTDSASKPGSGIWTVGSDARLKTDIHMADIDLCYSNVKNIPLKYYRWRDDMYTTTEIDDRRKLGWIAQDVLGIFPKACKIANMKGLSNCLTLNADQIYASMFGAIQKLQGMVEKLVDNEAYLIAEIEKLKKKR